MKIDKDTVLKAIGEDGYFLAHELLPKDFCRRCTAEIDVAIQKEAGFHGTKDYKDYGMLQICPLYGGTFLELLDNKEFLAPINWVLGDGSIIYAYITTSLPPFNGQNYASRIHVDRPRIIDGFMEAFGALVFVSDFTEENGATYILPGSQYMKKRPTDEYFNEHAIRVVAKAGSVFYFNIRLWHKGGINRTDTWRHALGLQMTRPYFKQKFDLPRAIAHMDTDTLSDRVKQKLGFFAQVPASLEEYYAPPEKRKYRQRSEWEVAREEGYEF